MTKIAEHKVQDTAKVDEPALAWGEKPMCIFSVFLFIYLFTVIYIAHFP